MTTPLAWKFDLACLDETVQTIGLVFYSDKGKREQRRALKAQRDAIRDLLEAMSSDRLSDAEEDVYDRIFNGLSFLTEAIRCNPVNDAFLRRAKSAFEVALELSPRVGVEADGESAVQG